jgi:hypothetical protein
VSDSDVGDVLDRPWDASGVFVIVPSAEGEQCRGWECAINGPVSGFGAVGDARMTDVVVSAFLS